MHTCKDWSWSWQESLCGDDSLSSEVYVVMIVWRRSRNLSSTHGLDYRLLYWFLWLYMAVYYAHVRPEDRLYLFENAEMSF